MSERKCVLTQCCCGCTLKTGAWVTAIICLITSIIQVIGNIMSAVNQHNNASWGQVIISIVMLIIAILLVVGIQKSNTRFIRIWVYTQLVLCVLGIILLVVASILTLNIFVLLFGLFIYGLVIYLILVVRSYAIELDEGGASQNPA